MAPHAAAAHLQSAWRDVAGVDPSAPTLGVLWAQWALETGRGRSMHGYNFGGLKGGSPDGGTLVLDTREGFGDTERRIRSGFRAYDGPAAGARDYVRTLRDDYPEAFSAAASGDSSAFVEGLARRRYFTADPDAYRSAISSLAGEFQRIGPSSGPLEVDAPRAVILGVLQALSHAIGRRRA